MDAPAGEPPAFAQPEALTSALGDALHPLYLADEHDVLARLREQARLPEAQRAAVQAQALQLVLGVRTTRSRGGGLDALLRQYHLGFLPPA